MSDKKKDKQKSTDSDLHDSAVRMGSAGGKVGGKKRAESLSAKERSDIARMGGLAKKAHLKDKTQEHKRKGKKDKDGEK